MPLSIRRRALLALFACALFAFSVHATKLRITSKPPGATVQINGVTVGTTPFEKDFPGGYFHKPRTALSSRLEHHLVARLTLPGYATREIVLSEGPMEWSSLNGRNRHQYWLIKSDRFEVTFDLITATFTGDVDARSSAAVANLSPELSLEALAAVAKPAVVQLQGLQKMGSGFFVTETGIIATNAHVARDEGLLLATLANGQQLEARVVYIDEDLDIALVKVPGENFAHLALADAQTVRQGESVLAIGNPGGAMQFSMTKGIVSAVGKFREAGSGTWVQTDAPVNPGNSGGPLLNMRGEVVGINTLKLIKKNATGIAFALSASDLLDVLHRFYPVVVPAPVAAPTPRLERMSAPTGSDSTDSVRFASSGTVTFTGTPGAKIYVDHEFVGNIPSVIRLPAGRHDIRVTDGKSADYLRALQVLAGSDVSFLAEFPIVP
jgi:S1-C subfamily serine protease